MYYRLTALNRLNGSRGLTCRFPSERFAMSSKRTITAVALAGLLLLSAVAAAGSVAGYTAATATANDDLSVAVENVGNDGATVTVTANGSAVENASVNVTAADNASYAGAGDYETGPNGTVSLPEPNETVTVSVTAASGTLSASTTATLNADEPDEEPGSFGQMVSAFVHQMLNAGDREGPLGRAVSAFVTANNPGSEHRPDHAGKPADAGKPDHAGTADAGKPAHAGSTENSTAGGDDSESPGNAGNAGNGHDQKGDDEQHDETKGEKNGHGKGR